SRNKLVCIFQATEQTRNNALVSPVGAADGQSSLPANAIVDIVRCAQKEVTGAFGFMRDIPQQNAVEPPGTGCLPLKIRNQLLYIQPGGPLNQDLRCGVRKNAVRGRQQVY